MRFYDTSFIFPIYPPLFIGYTGNKCHRECRSNRWGKDCRNNCYCSNGAACNSKTGECNCTEGWKGDFCIQQCGEGEYGRNCAQECKCQNDAKCDRYLFDLLWVRSLWTSSILEFILLYASTKKLFNSTSNSPTITN